MRRDWIVSLGFLAFLSIVIVAMTIGEMRSHTEDTRLAETCISAGGTWTEGRPTKPATCSNP